MADADRRRRARRLAHRLRQDPARRPAGRTAGIVDNAVATVQPGADAKGVRVQTLLDPRIGPVSGDPDRLQQVVWNLLSNAVKFTPKGGRVQVRLERVNSHIELDRQRHRRRHQQGVPAARVRALPAGRLRIDAQDRRPRPRPGDRPPPRRDARRHGARPTSAGEDQGATFTVRLPLMIVQPAASTHARASAHRAPQSAAGARRSRERSRAGG